ncbi:hypothetical protein MO973_44595 [Paenibacillus sp. TRM 82003]|uniref:hypothetical protein n=1 Tax=Kineococcus sp. TRM81007 TaxID=2925831 RepID=UPI001F59B4A8|nr:hypothetical protein [Kineococcus sp. TRM81007]MCI2238613.1 hypothetical protein [Kineococcus sp. TRM81007]MCI3927275.1 hypothetical protein [Paenibacillus sp. TRM 82003]
MLDVPVVIPLTLLALGVGTLGCLVRPRWDVAVVTGLLSAVWTRVNGPVEGRILHTWTADRGFTEADVLSVLALLAVGTALLRCGLRMVRGARPGPSAGPRGTAWGPEAHQGP